MIYCIWYTIYVPESIPNVYQKSLRSIPNNSRGEQRDLPRHYLHHRSRLNRYQIIANILKYTSTNNIKWYQVVSNQIAYYHMIKYTYLYIYIYIKYIKPINIYLKQYIHVCKHVENYVKITGFNNIYIYNIY